MIKWFENLKISSKIMLIVIIMVLALAATAAMGIFGMQQLNSLVSDITRQGDLVGSVVEIKANLFYEREMLLELAMDAGIDVNQQLGHIEEVAAATTHSLTSIEELLQSATSEEQTAWNRVNGELQSYLSSRDAMLNSMGQRVNSATLRTYLFGEGNEVFNSVVEQLEDYLGVNQALTEQREEEAAQTFARTISTQLILTLIVSIVLLVMGLVISRIIARPLVKLQAMAQKVADGDLTVEVIDGGKDEVGQVISAFSRMLDNLKELIEVVVDIAENVESSSEELSSAANQSSAAVQEVAASTQQFASSVQQIASNSQNIAESSNEVSDMASSGEKELNRATNQMADISTMIKQLSQVVQGLGDQSSEIEKIIDMIASIAEQTNLLALNAAIEAARAGEHGRGFAVVAENIRKLAEQSSQATSEIRSMIVGINKEVGKAVDTVEVGYKEVEEGTQVISQTEKVFNRIIGAIERLDEKIQGISAATQQLGSGSEEISASTEEQSAQVEQIAGTAQSLAERSEKLTGALSKFTV